MIEDSPLVPALLNWYRANARDLPWRRTRDPYAIWVSEIMLQQTQVKTVIPYWNRWMEKLPTIQSLVRARPQTIHKLWEGLGYYTRVRNMQKAARVIVQEHDGKFPREFSQVLELPGIGRYTAGAICSIAFNQPAPILDGNVVRVLARVFALRGDPRETKTNETLWQITEKLVLEAAGAVDQRTGTRPSRLCSLFNQSLMELGALVCTPKQPRCGLCPVAQFCLAARQGLTDKLPTIKSRPVATHRRFVAFVLSQNDHFLVRRRPEGMVNAHLWEFPNVEIKKGDGDVDHNACELLGGEPIPLQPLCRIKHSITRYRISLEAYQATVAARDQLPAGEGRWLDLRGLRRLPFASAHKKILDRLENPTS